MRNLAFPAGPILLYTQQSHRISWQEASDGSCDHLTRAEQNHACSLVTAIPSGRGARGVKPGTMVPLRLRQTRRDHDHLLNIAHIPLSKRE